MCQFASQARSLREPTMASRETAKRRQAIGGLVLGIERQLLALAIAFLLVAGVLLVSSYNPLTVFKSLIGSFGTDPYGTLRWATPFIFTGLATAVAFRARVWNIGMDGQLYIGALAGAATGLYVAPHVDANIGVGVVLVASTLGGAAWALPAAFLRLRWGVPEIITTILLIEIASLFVSYMVLGPMKGAGSYGASLSTDPIDRRMWLRPLAWQEPATVGLYISIIAALIVGCYVYRSRQGFEISTFGDNRQFSAYAGMNNQWIFMRTMLISGGLSGLAGGIEVLGSMHRLPNEFAANLGFQGIAVSLVAHNNPFGVIISGIFFGGLKTGGTNLQLHTDTPRDVVDVISAIVILVITAQVGHRYLKGRQFKAAILRVTRQEEIA